MWRTMYCGGSARFIILTCLITSSTSIGLAETKQESPTDLEDRVHALIRDGKLAEIPALRTSRQDHVNPDFAILRKSLVWRVEGRSVFVSTLEYLASTSVKAHETLILIDKPQLSRVHRIARSVASLQHEGVGRIRFQLAYRSKDRLHVVDLDELVTETPGKSIEDFLARLTSDDAGWEAAFNMQTNENAWPGKEVRSTLIITADLP